MRVGIIDLGTNSVRFDVHQIGPAQRVERLHREKLMVRLGQDVFLTGKLNPDAARRTLQAFESFASTARDLHVNKVIAFGTSALREAADSAKLLERIRKKCGIEVRVISGDEEARLIAQGVLGHEKAPKGLFALVDIGGGSTEISVCRSSGKSNIVLHAKSFGLGAARLQQVFLKTSPPKPASKSDPHPIDQLRRYVKSILLPTLITEDWPRVDRVLGSSGTILALAKAGKKNGSRQSFDRKDLKKLITAMSGMTTSQLLGMPGIEARRVDMILAGAILLDEVLEALRAKKVLTTDYSLRDGILDEEIRRYREKQTTSLSFHLDDLWKKARKLGIQETHTQQVCLLSKQLFDQLTPLHRLKPQWRTYLLAAAILHDTGESISITDHQTHSYYIVKNAEFPAMEEWETDFIASLCLWHKGGKVSPKSLPFRQEKEKREAFFKLLALLRIADALDRSHKAFLQIKKVKLDRNEVVLRITEKTATDLEILRLEQKKDLFEKIFKRSLRIERSRRMP